MARDSQPSSGSYGAWIAALVVLALGAWILARLFFGAVAFALKAAFAVLVLLMLGAGLYQLYRLATSNKA